MANWPFGAQGNAKEGLFLSTYPDIDVIHSEVRDPEAFEGHSLEGLAAFAVLKGRNRGI